MRAVSRAMVPDYAAIDAGIRRFIGRKLVASDTGVAQFECGEDVEVQDIAEYRRAVKDGDLEACDAATAAICGVKFVAKKEVSK